MTVTAAAWFRAALGCFPSGVTVVTATADGDAHAMTATAFSSVSLDPPLVLVCVRQETRFHGIVLAARSFAVTVLAEGQRHTSTWFASPRASGFAQFQRFPWRPGPVSGAPVLEGGVAYVDCVLVDAFPGGDHSIMVGRVDDVGLLNRDAPPLVHFQGGYSALHRTGTDAGSSVAGSSVAGSSVAGSSVDRGLAVDASAAARGDLAVNGAADGRVGRVRD